jgi:streptogramin lyase
MFKNAANSKKSRVGIFALILSALFLGVNSPVHAADGIPFADLQTSLRLMTRDQAGNIYTANSGNDTVSRISPEGDVSTFGPTGSFPRGVAVDSSGNIYTANTNDGTVSKITPKGNVTKTFASTGAGSKPYQLVIDKAGNIYTANPGNNTVSKITPEGISIPDWVQVGPHTVSTAISIDQADNLYIAQCGDRIDGSLATELLDTPINLINDVRKITPSKEVTILGTTGQCPDSIIFDSSGNIYTSNFGASFGWNISKITPTGVSTILNTTGEYPHGAGASPYALAIDPLGNLYVSNLDSKNVSKITPAGVSTILGSTGASGPRGIVYSSGTIYVANSNGTVIKFPLTTTTSGSTPNSQVATISSGQTGIIIPSTAALPATTLKFGGTVPMAVTVIPVVSNPASEASTPFTISGSTKIVDIQITGTFTGSATVCLDGAETDQLFHYVGGKWEELPSRTYANGQVCGVTTSFSPFAAASTAAKTAAAAASTAASAAAKAAAEAAAAKREAEKQAARADITSKLKSAKDLTVDSFAKAEIPGITASNIAAVQAELLALPESSRTDINQVLKVAHKYEVVGNIGSDQINYMQSNSFVEIGLIPATSKNKVALVAAVKKLPAASRDTYAEIKAAIDAATKEIQVRSDRLAAVISRNASRNSK